MEEKKFDKKEYDRIYHQEHKGRIKQWKVDLPKAEKEEYDELLKTNNITKVDFLRNSFKKLKEETKMKELLEKYEIESVEEFEPNFYHMNLTNGYVINRRAVNNLLQNYSKEELIKITNYNEIGIVEYVANNQYYIENNEIIADE